MKNASNLVSRDVEAVIFLKLPLPLPLPSKDTLNHKKIFYHDTTTSKDEKIDLMLLTNHSTFPTTINENVA